MVVVPVKLKWSPKVRLTAEPSKKEEIKEEAKKPVLFDVGSEEKKLLELSKFVQTKITNKEWSEIAKQTKNEKYVVQEGEWLMADFKKTFWYRFLLF